MLDVSHPLVGATGRVVQEHILWPAVWLLGGAGVLCSRDRVIRDVIRVLRRVHVIVRIGSVG